jgi:beta-glucanase (GH16 family)
MQISWPVVALLLGIVQGLSIPQSRHAGSRSETPVLRDGKYIVSTQATFSNAMNWTFESGSLPSGLSASDYPVGAEYAFGPANVNVRNGYLELLVNGGQTTMPYKCGEVTTDVQNIKYASVRTVAILTEPAGVCNGMFFYESDTQETDIEWLSDAQSDSNGGTRYLWLTNQATTAGGNATISNILPPAHPTSTEHEYRIDWTEGLVQWYVDGRKVFETTENVPSVPGPWVWNNWSNGDQGWSVGPPQTDALFKIRRIDMYYNTA